MTAEEEEEQVKQQLIPKVVKIVSNSRTYEKRSQRMSSPETSPSPPSSPTIRHIPLPKLYRFQRLSQCLLLTLVIFSLGIIAIIVDSFLHHQRDVSGCRQSYMRPQYIKQVGFDSEMTRFAGKYSLYLYREKGVDFTDKPTGVPVLFIPGHAGSYKQVRSLAAEAAFSYYSKYENHAYSQPPGTANLDFFTVDFNEEFSALHGQSILEQAEYLNDAIDYILKLYSQTRTTDLVPDATSVIIVGHSMGGIVARTMFMMHNHQAGTINTIITLSTPHLLPPAPFDWKISQLYDDMNRLWQEKPWKDLAMVSIAGGTLDNTVCSDSTNIEAILSPEHGFTVFSTAVPHVWTAADHVSVLTCNQLVKVVSRTLLDIVDIRRGSQTKPLKERMQILRQAFLSGLEDRQGNGSDIILGNVSEFDKSMVWILPPGKRLVIEQDSQPGLILMPTVANADAFAILTDDQVGIFDRFEFYLCQSAESVVCQGINSIVVPVPASTERDMHPFSGNTFSFASLRFDEMKSYRYLAIRDKGTGPRQFLVAEPFDTKLNHQVIHQSMLSIALEGVQIKTKHGMFTSIRIPSIESPILAYHLKVARPYCQSHFAPFLRQSISTMHESKFYVNLAGNEETEISIHGRTAFAAVVNHRDKHGLVFQIWMDPSCSEPLQLDLSIDWYGSAGRLGFRNGIMLATFSFIVVVLVFACQIRCYNNSGIYPHFGQGLSFCLQRTLPLVMVCLTLCSIGQCTSYFKDTFWGASVARKDVMTGNTDPFFWWIPLLGLTVSVGIVCLLWLIVEGFLRSIARFSECCAFTLWPIARTQETRYHQIQRRAITTCVLFMLVATCIPYQFVFVVAFFVQIIGCVRALMRLRIPSAHRRRENRYNFMFSLLLLFFTLLPFNLPILLVWIRNISVNWFVPFSSDHSVLAIAPIMVYVEILTSNRKMLPRQNNRLWSTITYGLMYCIVIYAFLFGIKYTHWIYFSANHLITWFLLLHFRDSHYSRLYYHYLMDHMGSKKQS